MRPVIHQSTFTNILKTLEAWLKSSALAEAGMASGSKIWLEEINKASQSLYSLGS